MKHLKLLIVCMLIIEIYSFQQSPDNSEACTTKTKSEDTVSETERAISQFVPCAYKIISFEQGTTHDYFAMKSIFIPHAGHWFPEIQETKHFFRGTSCQLRKSKPVIPDTV